VLIRPAATIKLLARSPKDEESRVAQTLPEPGQTAADFALPAGPDESVRLSDLRGRPVILAFYPADWSPVCSDQMALYALVRPEFDRYNAALLGISTDGVWCHRAFAEQHGINFPLLADFEPKGDVARRYGAYVNGEGVAARALVVIDPEGRVAWSYRSPQDVNPGADGILAALDGLAGARPGSAGGTGTRQLAG
jgi:peroxiredoxin